MALYISLHGIFIQLILKLFETVHDMINFLA